MTMSLTTPSKLRELQIKLYRKAKNEASTGAIARHQPLQSKWYSANWGKCSSAESGSNLVRESAVKPVGKPDALIGHVRFDERGWETGRRSGVSTRAHPRLYKLAAFRRCDHPPLHSLVFAIGLQLSQIPAQADVVLVFLRSPGSSDRHRCH